MTFELDMDIIMFACQTSMSKVIQFKSYCPDSDTLKYTLTD